MCELLAVFWSLLGRPLCLRCLFGRNGMRPRITEAKSRCSFLGGKFCRRLYNGAEWIAQLPRIYPVGVVDAPELIACGRCFIHGRSETEGRSWKMFQLHKMRGQSRHCPMRGHANWKTSAQNRGIYWQGACSDIFPPLPLCGIEHGKNVMKINRTVGKFSEVRSKRRCACPVSCVGRPEIASAGMSFFEGK